MPFPRLALATLILAVPSAAIAGPRDDLLRLVPDDYTFCVVVQNLRAEGQSAGGSFLKGLTDSPLIQALQGQPEAQRVQQVFTALLGDLGISAEQFRDDLLGDALVFAYRKDPSGDDRNEAGLILLHARDEQLLRRVVRRIIDVQTRAGEIRGVEPVGDGDGRYFRRMKTVETESADFYAIRGQRLAFSSSEGLLKSLLPRLAAQGAGEPPIARRMKQLGVHDAPAAVLINPRSFDADVAASARKGKEAEQAFLKEFATYWKAVDGLALFVNLRPSLEVGLALNARPVDLPAAAAKFLSEARGRSPLWDRIPDDALFAVAGRIPVESLAAMAGAFLTEADRQRVVGGIRDAVRPFLETNDLGALARGLGPDMGFWVTAPEPGTDRWCPRAVLAVRRADGPDGLEAEQAALRGLDFVARLAALQHKGLRVHSQKAGSVDVRYLTHPTAFPVGFRPAFAAKGGYVLVADSPETLTAFEPPAGPAAEADEVPILRVSLSGWRRYLKTHQPQMVEYLARLRQADPKEIARPLGAVLPLLDGIDRVEVVQRNGRERVALVLRLREIKK